MKSISLAILITCYNRRSQTLDCLSRLAQQQLAQQQLSAAVSLQVFVVDDGSTDGTSEAIATAYPETKILHGDGNLFWNGGMRLAFATAIETGYDYYLWLNDDTHLQANALAHLLKTCQDLAQLGEQLAIVVGATQDPQTGEMTYGGAMRSKSWRSKTFRAIEPSNVPIQCETMFGNCVLIPHQVVARVGNLDAAFIHSHGDVDYGLRACQLGCSVWVAPGYIGTCRKNSVTGSWADLNLPLFVRLQKAFQPKAFPLKAWTTFVRRHYGFFWFIYWWLPYIRSVIGYRNLSRSNAFAEVNAFSQEPHS